jgi:hypothetical protein
VNVTARSAAMKPPGPARGPALVCTDADYTPGRPATLRA